MTDAPNSRVPGAFEQYQRTYNFPLRCSRADLFRRLIESEIAHRRAVAPSQSIRLLDIGCGRGLEGSLSHPEALSRVVDEFWGVEPDPEIVIPTGIFAEVRRTLLEEATLPRDYFDVAYCYLVAEHVADPSSFLASVRQALRPGGAVYIFTPNVRHFFGMASATLERLGVDEFVLRRLRAKEELEAYHYPVKYRMNSHRHLEALAQEAGFSSFDIAMVENPNDTEPYFPRGTKWIWRLLMSSREVRHSPGRLLHLIGRLER